MELTLEQKQEIQEAMNKLIEAFRPVVETVEKTIKAFKELFVQLWKNLKDFINKNEKAKKYFKIYNRTHNQRIKKKQIKKILKMLE